MSSRFIVRAAFIAAIYFLICLVAAPLSYGIVQVRFSEALTLLPVLCPEAVLGVTVGCFIANIFSSPLDMVVGTLATLMAALCTRKLRNIRWHGPGKRFEPGLPIAASLPPVLFNAVIIGAELTILQIKQPTPCIFLFNIVSVGAGQIINCCVLGLILIYIIERRPTLYKLLSDTNNAQ